MALLGLLAGLPALSIDLSAPTLTILPSALGTDVTVAGFTLTLFMVGFAAGLVTGGRMSDSRGRRPTLLAALFLYSLSGVCCSLATTAWGLVAARFVQGVGAGACAVQASAIVQDLFEGAAARRRQSQVTLVIAVVPLLAPAIGARFVQAWGWRSVHAVLAVGGVALLALVFAAFRETRGTGARTVSRGLGLQDAGSMLQNGEFRRVVAANALSYGCIFAYISGAPGVVMGQFGHSADAYAALFALTALALTAGTAMNIVLDRRGANCGQVVRPALLLQSLASIALMLAGSEPTGIWRAAIVSSLVLSCFARGMVSPNMTFMAVSFYRSQPGLAAALLGLLQLIGGAIASAIVAAVLPNLGYFGVAATMAASAAAAFVVWQGRTGGHDPVGA